MPINLAGVPFKLDNEDMGVTDYQKAIRSGLDTFIKGQEAKFTPKNLAEELLAKQLQNKINTPKANYAEDITLADLANTRARTGSLEAETGLAGLKKRLLGGQATALDLQNSLQQQIMDATSGQQQNANNVVGNNTANESETSTNTGTSNNANQSIMSPGNESLYHLDELYDKNPFARSFLEKQGFKKTQTVKYDPKTGNVAVITTSPSGKVTLSNNRIGTALETIPNTNATTTLQQNVVNGVANSLPVLNELIGMEIPGQAGGQLVSPNQQAAYKAKAAALTDSMVAAFGLPKTNESINLMKLLVEKQRFETDSAYKKRLNGVVDELRKRRKNAQQVLRKGTSTNSNDNNSSSLVWGTINDPNTGERVRIQIPQNEAKEFVADGGLLDG